MTISESDLKFFAAERMTDEDDGGGRMSAVEILTGAENSIFDDLSDVDRAAGDCSLRKVFAAVASDSADKYLDAGAVLLTPPADPAVSVLMFSTGSHYDERSDLQARLELSISRGGLYQGWLYGSHSTGQRAVVLWQRPSAALPEVGARLDLAERASNVEQHHQVLWVTRIVDELVERTDDKGTYQVRVVTCELAEGLRADYTGSEPSRTDPGAGNTVVYRTRYNPDAVTLHGIAPLAAEAGIGDRAVTVSDLYCPLIPTAFAETALADTTPGGDTAALVSAGVGAFSVTTTAAVIAPGVSLFLGSLAQPGSISISVSGSTLTDDGNKAVRLSGLTVGAVDYSNGVITWADNCPNYGTAEKSITFKPAAQPVRVANTASQVVTVENRGYVWVITLAPIPAPGSLRVAYRVNNAWYVIQDQGGGSLAGVDSSYGSGTLNFGTGTVTIATGEIPDADSEILYTWATPVNYFARGGESVEAPVVRGQTANVPVTPGSVTVTWLVGGTTYTLTDNGAGVLTGTGGTGGIVYRTGAWWVRPTTLPPMGQEFDIEYDYGTQPTVTDTWDAPARGGDGKLHLTLSQTPTPGSIRLEVGVDAQTYEEVTSYTQELTPTLSTPDELVIYPPPYIGDFTQGLPA